MSHSVLLLGSGFVAKPTLDVLALSGIRVTVGELLNWAIEGFVLKAMDG